MTTHLTSSFGDATVAHLTDDQLSELLAVGSGHRSGDDAATEAHLATCKLCAGELAELRESFSIFREATVACANNAYEDRKAHADGESLDWVAAAQRPQMLHPAFWTAAAAMLLTAVLLPLQLRPHAAVNPVTTHSSPGSGESDEALLESIDRDLSASVPTQMQALADPSGNSDPTLLQMSIQSSNLIASAPSVAVPTSAQGKN
jgi:hypothetical protein